MHKELLVYGIFKDYYIEWSRMRASNPRPAAFSLIATITLYQLQDRRATNCANPAEKICVIWYLTLMMVCNKVSFGGASCRFIGET